MSQSVHLASLVQKEFRHTCKRADRGVHQAGFLVLKASAMPSILVELGFISNPEENVISIRKREPPHLPTEYSVLSCLINVNMKYG